MQLRALFDFNEFSYCIYSIFRSIVKYSIKRFIILFLIRLIEYLIIERKIEYIQYKSSLKSNNARDYTNYSTLKAILIKISTKS